MTNKNPLLQLQNFGQSIWLDYLRRDLIESGQLDELINRDGLRGITSNPAIFAEAIGESDVYDEAIYELAAEGRTAVEIYEALATEDIRRTAVHFRPVYERLNGRDGFVSLEVSPRLARDTGGTIAEARRLWTAVDEPNVMIKVPGTKEGLPAIRQLLSEGINVNVTLLFGLPRYKEVAHAFLAGLTDRLESGQPIDHVSSVASFFLSRIDVLVDPLLEEKMAAGNQAITAQLLHGQVAIASAKVAYHIYEEIFGNNRFRRLADQGARPQRLLWASTSTKNPDYSDVKYVEALIGPDTVNTVPMKTLNAFRDHGRPAATLQQNLGEAYRVLDQLAQLDIDIDDVTEQLTEEGIGKFSKPFDRLLQRLEEKMEKTAV
ncbi:MAG: transaldolase [Anaerolineales bacterium]|nr:transaldolase [Anaerolineales bacterium]